MFVPFSVFSFYFLGDLGGSSVHDDVGEDTESKERAGLPNSPSSSGGFRQFSSKGLLCREDMSAQHYFGGIVELVVQEILSCLYQEFIFRL